MGYVFSNVAVDNFFREFMPFCVFLRKSGIFVVILLFWLLFGSFWHLITRHAYSVTGLARVWGQFGKHPVFKFRPHMFSKVAVDKIV